MKLLLRLSLVSICALFLIPASEDWKTGKPYILLFDDEGKIVKLTYESLLRFFFFVSTINGQKGLIPFG